MYKSPLKVAAKIVGLLLVPVLGSAPQPVLLAQCYPKIMCMGSGHTALAVVDSSNVAGSVEPVLALGSSSAVTNITLFPVTKGACMARALVNMFESRQLINEGVAYNTLHTYKFVITSFQCRVYMATLPQM
jgi:hypothetical protein